MNEERNGSGNESSFGSGVLSCALIFVVLAVVAAVLFPIFARPYTPARKSLCQSNMKECAIALQAYWNDYDAHLPSSALASGSPTWNKRDFETFAAGAGGPVDGHRPGSWCQVIYPYMKDKDITFCPSDESDHAAPGARTSYWWKLAVDKAWYGEQCVKPCRTEGDFGYNADQIVLYERAGFHCAAKEGLKNGVQVLAAYLDSHVRTITVTNGSSSGWVTSPSALGEPAFFNYDNDREPSDQNPPPPDTLANHVDPARFSDRL